MKVLIIDNYIAPYRVDLYNLIAESVDLTVCYGAQQDTTRDQRYTNENINFKTIFRKHIKIGSRADFSFEIPKIINKGMYDCVLVGGYDSPSFMYAISYMRRKKIPFMLNVDGSFINYNQNFFLKKLKSYFIKSANMIITSGESSAKALEFYGANLENIEYYPFAFSFPEELVLPSSSDKIAIKSKLEINEDIAILFVGRAMECKKIDVLLRAYASLKGDIALYFVGTTLTNEYSEIIKELGLENVKFIDFKTGKDLTDYFQACDFFVLPTDGEVWGLVVNEAMINSLPVITTTRCNAGLELIDNGINGLLIEPNDVEMLSNAMIKLIDNQELRDQISYNSYNSMKDHNIVKNKEAHIRAFNKFITENAVK